MFGIENLFCSAVEHSSVLDEILEKNRFNPVTLEKLSSNAGLACLMGANLETGRIYDGKELREKFPNTLILRDYSQSFAKGIKPDLENCDFGIFTPSTFKQILVIQIPQTTKPIDENINETKNFKVIP